MEQEIDIYKTYQILTRTNSSLKNEPLYHKTNELIRKLNGISDSVIAREREDQQEE